jgi:putative PEP-CTERM system integral membrane protein
MQALSEEVTRTIRDLKQLNNLELPVDVYLTASPFRGEEPSIVSLDMLDEQQLVYFGGQNAAQLLDQFETLQASERNDRLYDAVIVLTDGSGYELGVSEVQALDPSFPIWVVHVGGDIPLGYDDQTLQAIQISGGGVATSLEEALRRIAVSLNPTPKVGSDSSAMADLVDGYVWSVLPADQADSTIANDTAMQAHSSDDPFAALAARRLVLAEMQRNRGAITQLDTLDALHALAMKYQIVTPYSSMIVLVNSQQQAMLNRLSEDSDRYQREVEALGETTPGSPLPLAGVPEPHEWLLLGLAAAMLVYLLYSKRTKVLKI